MNENHNKALTPNAQKLRREMTAEERRLWYSFLKQLPVTVHRQKCVLRYANSDINHRFSAVCEDILRHLGLNED